MNQIINTENNNIQKFFEMEERYSLFDYQTKEGIKYWDIVRYEIFCYIISNNIFIQKNRKRNLLFIYKIIKYCFYLIIFLLKIFLNRPHYLCFICSRNKDNYGRNLDIISQDIISRLPYNKRLLIETFSNNNGKGQFSYIFNSGLILYKYLFKLKNIFHNNCDYYEIIEIISKTFNISINDKLIIDTIITNNINRYIIERNYYKKLFSLLKPKLIFMTQDGIQKGMFNAANYLNIPLVELQHGFIGYSHPVYSYPQSILRGQILDLPKYLFAFSHFWTKTINYPVNSIKYIGNSYYAKKITKKEIKYDIVFIMGLYNNCILSLIDNLLKLNFNYNICIKLHPAQIFNYNNILEKYKYTNNINIIRNELSISKLLSETECIITVNSTCIYEALHNNVKVFLLKVPGYYTMQNIYDNPLVKEITSAEDIISLKNINIINQKNNITYFEEFNEKEFYNFLDKHTSLC